MFWWIWARWLSRCVRSNWSSWNPQAMTRWDAPILWWPQILHSWWRWFDFIKRDAFFFWRLMDGPSSSKISLQTLATIHFETTTITTTTMMMMLLRRNNISMESGKTTKRQSTMVQNRKKTHKNSNLMIRFSMGEEVSKASRAEQAKEWAMRVNEQIDKRVAQYLRLNSWLFWPIVQREIEGIWGEGKWEKIK